MSELITGANGQLGRALREIYPDAVAIDHDELDISDAEAVRHFDFSEVKAIINAAAYTKVDEAETPEGMVAAFAANSQGVANLAAIARAHELTLVHISTDYVFDGQKKEPHTETDAMNPLSIYGRSKAAGDLAAQSVARHYIIRTSWVIGEGNNFARTMLSLAKKGVDPSVVADQIGRPSFTVDLAQAIDHLLKNAPEPGIYHCSNAGDTVSWADFAREIYQAAGHDPNRVSDTTTAEYFAGKDSIAPRPANSVLALEKIQSTGLHIRDWREALAEYIEKELS